MITRHPRTRTRLRAAWTWLTRAAGALALFAMSATPPVVPPAAAQPVKLEVTFTLTDPDYKPIAGVPVRLVFGSDPQWQAASAGQRFTTDANGVGHVAASVVLEKRWRKAPTNFVGSLVSRPQLTENLMIGAELPYMTYAWLYTVDVARFPAGDVMLDAFAVYTPDAEGRYTRRAREDSSGWKMADLDGKILTGPGHVPWDYMLEPEPGDSTRTRWRLKIAFKRSPPPISR